MKKLKVKFRLWIDTKDGDNVIGDGRWRLLEAIEKTGLLSSACKKLDISYRKAWGDLVKMQQALKMPLIEKHRGGTNGGRTGLTAFGKRFIKAYKDLHSEIEMTINKSSRKKFGSIK